MVENKDKYLRIKDLKKQKMLLWKALEISESAEEEKIIMQRIKEINIKLEEALRND